MEDAGLIIPQRSKQSIFWYRNIPEISGVYIVRDAKECLYVGQSKNLRRRWQVHDLLGMLRLFHVDLRLSWIAAPVDEIRALEKQTIRALMPQINRHHKP